MPFLTTIVPLSFPQSLRRPSVVTFPVPRNVTPAVDVTSNDVPSSCATVITPACVQALYNVSTTKASQSSNQLGVSGFIDEYANEADLQVRACERNFVL